jgi:hypothetical protein
MSDENSRLKCTDQEFFRTPNGCHKHFVSCGMDYEVDMTTFEPERDESILGYFPAGGRRFPQGAQISLCHHVQEGSEANTVSLTGTRSKSAEARSCSPPTNVGVKNAWSYAAYTPYASSLRGVELREPQA